MIADKAVTRILVAIVATCLLLAAYEARDDIRRKAARALARLGIGYIERCGDMDYYYLNLCISSRVLYAALFLLLALALALWPVIVRAL